MSKHGTQSVDQRLDPESQQYINELRNRARGYAEQGFKPYDPKSEMPYMQNYLDATAPMWQQIREMGQKSIGDQATQAGAFGGTRQDVASGAMLGNIGIAQGQQAYGAAHEQAYSEFLRQQNFNPQILAMLEGAIGPTGMTQTQHTTSSPWMQLLGMGLGFAAGGPAGAAVAAGAGSHTMNDWGNADSGGW